MLPQPCYKTCLVSSSLHLSIDQQYERRIQFQHYIQEGMFVLSQSFITKNQNHHFYHVVFNFERWESIRVFSICQVECRRTMADSQQAFTEREFSFLSNSFCHKRGYRNIIFFTNESTLLLSSEHKLHLKPDVKYVENDEIPSKKIFQNLLILNQMNTPVLCGPNQKVFLINIKV